MADVFERVDAIGTLLPLLPPEAQAGSAFADDASLLSFETYDVVRARLQDGTVSLVLASRIARDPSASLFGTHLIALRGALVAAAKGWWITATDDPITRASNAIRMVSDDRSHGHMAMRAAGDAGDIPAFEAVANAFLGAMQRLQEEGRKLGVDISRPPSDSRLVDELGREIDSYYGADGSALRDARLLWNASSSLAHGERWFRDLTTPKVGVPAQRTQVAEVMTGRSLDVVCSGLNLLWQRTLLLATAGAP